ncbi:MAG: dihydropteroate synthase [Candidatus Zixiibacteriota bacterium]|nr:MAG: dihydropteroate synthase [candidate division Zixibacteria bacterium]
MPLAKKKTDLGAIRLKDSRQLSLTGTVVMGVLNVTPDSFSDGGNFENTDRAISRALEMEKQGADIIDIGGESTRPGATGVSVEDETERVIPVIDGLRRKTRIPISIDTYKSEVAAAALDHGADIVNDVSALRFDSKMASLVSSRGVPVILMHMLGTPLTMQKEPRYDNCVKEIADFFEERLQLCETVGISGDRIILDPGIGFGKRLSDNIEVLARLAEFKRFGVPLLVGTSRKSFIGMLHDKDAPAHRRLGGSIASMVAAILNGANIVRVHDVAESVEAIKIISAIREGV